MNSYEELLIHADQEDLIVKEKKIDGFSGLIYGNRIAIHEGITTDTEKSCVLAEELGHYHTNVGDVMDQNVTENRKQEAKARMWAYNNRIGLLGIVDAFQHRCQNRHEVAEYLGVTEPFLQDALEAYKRKYGSRIALDNYTVYFEPCLGVLEKLE